MASPDRKRQKVLKAKKTMPTSCRKQMDLLNKSKNAEILKTPAVRSNISNGNQNLSAGHINSNCRHSGNVNSLYDSKNTSVSLQRSIGFSQDLIKPAREIVGSETRSENTDKQVASPYQKPKKTDSSSKYATKEANGSRKPSETHFKSQLNVSRSLFEHGENYNQKSSWRQPVVSSGSVQNSLNNKGIDKLTASLEATSNSESQERKQNDILSSKSYILSDEKAPDLVNAVTSSNCTVPKTEESSRICYPRTFHHERVHSRQQSPAIDSSNSHNQKKIFLENKENAKHPKATEQLDEHACSSLERQAALLEQAKQWIRQEIYRINYKLFDKKLDELSERIGKTQCRNKHEAIAGQLFVKVGKLQRRITSVLSLQMNCLDQNKLPKNATHKITDSETKSLAMNRESVNGPKERMASANHKHFSRSAKTSERINSSSSECVEFVSESNTDDVMLISVENPNLKTPNTSCPTENEKMTPRDSSNSSKAIIEVGVLEKKLDLVIDLTREGLSNCNIESPALVLKSPSTAVVSSKEITPVAEKGAKAVGSFQHLPPLPEPPPLLPELADKVQDTLPPQKPELRVKWVPRPRGIALTWNITRVNPKCAPVESYLLFLCREDTEEKLAWKKIGEIKASPLPMACTLSQFLPSNKYYFTVQSKDIFGRYGPFGDIKSIPGFSENVTKSPP